MSGLRRLMLAEKLLKIDHQYAKSAGYFNCVRAAIALIAIENDLKTINTLRFGAFVSRILGTTITV
jgi:hypothetical protein